MPREKNRVVETGPWDTMRERTWLVQRLELPIRATHPDSLLAKLAKDNPFSFGGGLRNGGLSGEAMDMLREVWSFAYMGAAEFEWGAVPATLQQIAIWAERGDLEAFSFTIPLKGVEKHYRDKRRTVPKGDATLWAIAPKSWHDEVIARVTAMARPYSHPDHMALKEETMLASILRPEPPSPDARAEKNRWEPTVRGWLEIDNSWLFFADETMWSKTCSLFGVEAATVTA